MGLAPNTKESKPLPIEEDDEKFFDDFFSDDEV